MIIAFYNFKGGVGTTTLAAHTCALAHELGLRVAGVSADFKHELPRWLEGLKIPCITLDPAGGDERFDLIFDELAATRAAAEASHDEVRGALEVLKARAKAARVPVDQPSGLTAGQVLRMTEAEPQRVSDPGLDAVLSQVRAQLAHEPDPLSPNEVRLAAVTGRKTVDEWLASLARAGRELVCGLRTAQQIAERLSPRVEVGYRALLHPQTILRFKARPGRARLDTLARIAVASGRADILELQLRDSERTGGDQPPASAGWPHVAPALRTVN